MRVLSQNGRKDIPYEKFCFGITEHGNIIAAQNTAESIGVILESTIEIFFV